MGIASGRFITGCCLTLIVFELVGCAAKPIPVPTYTPVSVGWESKPFRYQRQLWIASFDGGAAKNGAGYWHVLSRTPEEVQDVDSERNPCRKFREKLEALERCEFKRQACVYPLPD
jgi:hypothetical protein